MGFWEIPEEDQPPQEFYGDDERISQWFDEVKLRRRSKVSGGGSDLEEVPLMENELELPKFW